MQLQGVIIEIRAQLYKQMKTKKFLPPDEKPMFQTVKRIRYRLYHLL